jgi:hypothetical protein
MKNFQFITTFDHVALLHQIQRNQDLWNENRIRTSHEGSAHKDASDILIRFNECDWQKVPDDLESFWYPSIYELTAARPIIFGLMARVEGERLGRVIVTKVPPGKRILPHEDGGYSPNYYQRYHCVLQGLPGSIFRCGDEQVTMRTGEIWWLQNLIEHEVINNSVDDRIHLIVDIRC